MAFEIIMNRDTNKWSFISYLLEAYEAQHMTSAMQTELNNSKMRYGDKVQEYSKKVENVFFKLSSVSTARKIRE